jgi:hypothetical protein
MMMKIIYQRITITQQFKPQQFGYKILLQDRNIQLFARQLIRQLANFIRQIGYYFWRSIL